MQARYINYENIIRKTLSPSKNLQDFRLVSETKLTKEVIRYVDVRHRIINTIDKAGNKPYNDKENILIILKITLNDRIS